MSEVSNGTGIREHLLLFSRFLRNPRTVGALSPSSKALAYDIVNGLDLSGAVRVVELGPGTGALTGAIVEKIGAEARFFAVDIEPAFVRQIRQRWPDIECVCASAEQASTAVAARPSTHFAIAMVVPLFVASCDLSRENRAKGSTLAR